MKNVVYGLCFNAIILALIAGCADLGTPTTTTTVPDVKTTTTTTTTTVPSTTTTTVPAGTVPVTGITVSSTTLMLSGVGTTSVLTATVTPSDATDKTVTWSSDNAAITTVSGGTVTAVRLGRASVTATAGSFSSACTVTVIPAGIVTTIAGDGFMGLVNGTDPLAARFVAPVSTTVAGTNLYILEGGNHCIRKMDLSTGEVSTFAGTGSSGFTDGAPGFARFRFPQGIMNDGTYLYVADAGNGRVRKIAIDTGVVSTMAAGSPTFNRPHGVATDGTNLYITECNSHRIQRIVIATEEVSVFAGSPTSAQGTTDGTGTAALFDSPSGIVTDGTNLYVSDTGNNTVRKIVIATREVTTLAGGANGNADGYADGTGTASQFFNPLSAAIDGTHLYLGDWNYNMRRIEIATGLVTTFAGNGAQGNADGTGSAAQFTNPYSVSTDGYSLYVADASTNRIRKIR